MSWACFGSPVNGQARLRRSQVAGPSSE
jgi:hypothetical protein